MTRRIALGARALAASCASLTLALAAPSGAQVRVTSNRYDANRTAANLAERTLTPANVRPASFGKAWSYAVDGAIFAQPLYLPAVGVPGVGVRDLLFVATMHDLVYAFDADRPGAPLWKADLRPAGATAGASVYAELGDAIGVVSTPVIDESSNRLFVLARTSEAGRDVHRLHALDLRTGAEAQPSVVVEATSGGHAVNASNVQRAGLALAGGQIYVAFGGNPHDAGDYQGWVLTYDAGTLRRTGAFVTTREGGASIWQSGGAPPVDGASNVYFLTGNGLGTGAGYDGTTSFAETLLAMHYDGSALHLRDWLTPSNWSFLDTYDLDLSCNAPMLVPGTDLLAFGSKSANVYVAHKDALGHEQAGDPQLVQEFHVGPVSFASPATGYPGILVGSAPAMASFGGRLYVAFQANDPSHTLFVTSSADGASLTSPATGYPGIRVGSAPAMASFGGKLYVAFQADDASHALFVTSSADGASFASPATGYPGIRIGGAPAMAEFHGRLYVAFQANDPSHTLFVTSSADGVHFTSPAIAYPGIRVGSAPAMTVFGDRLYVAFQADDPGHALFVTSSADGASFTTPAIGYPGILTGGAPAMAALDGLLYVAFQANDPGHRMYVTSSADGAHFTTPAQGYPGILVGSAPAMTTFGGALFASFQANDPGHALFVTRSSDDGNFQSFNDGNRIIGLAYWQRSSAPPLLYAWPGDGVLTSFPFRGGRFDTRGARYGAIPANGEPGVALSLSANGDARGSGIVWAARTADGRDVGKAGILHAFDAEALTELWSSAARPADAIGALAKFVVPVVANGRVYVASSSNAVHVFAPR